LPDDPGVAEAAVTVVDECQGRGLGTILIEALGAVALEHGIGRFRGYLRWRTDPCSISSWRLARGERPWQIRFREFWSRRRTA
jgi:GNAT superfamily N-acetyltransferase